MSSKLYISLHSIGIITLVFAMMPPVYAQDLISQTNSDLAATNPPTCKLSSLDAQSEITLNCSEDASPVEADLTTTDAETQSTTQAEELIIVEKTGNRLGAKFNDDKAKQIVEDEVEKNSEIEQTTAESEQAAPLLSTPTSSEETVLTQPSQDIQPLNNLSSSVTPPTQSTTVAPPTTFKAKKQKPQQLKQFSDLPSQPPQEKPNPPSYSQPRTTRRSPRPLSPATFQPSTPRPDSLPGNGNRFMLYPLAVSAPVTSEFGWRVHPISGDTKFHSGTDLGAPLGTPVVAAFSGRVVTADWLGGYGQAVILLHQDGHSETLYGHLSEIYVHPGEQIQQGEILGRVGSTGNSTGPHLHFEYREWEGENWIAKDARFLLAQAMKRQLSWPLRANYFVRFCCEVADRSLAAC